MNAAKSVAESKSPQAVRGGVFSPSEKGGTPGVSTGNGSSSRRTGSDGLEYPTMLITAHGVIMAVTVVLLLPCGALAMRLLGFAGLVWFHAGFQVLSLFLFTAGFGIGVYMANELGLVSARTLILDLLLHPPICPP